ncbi:MAG: MFS transporter [Pseudohongiellaceae bacterium]
MTAGRFSALRSAFANRNYAIYISGNCLSLVGFWMQRLAVSWLTWEISRSAFWVGAVAFAEIFPLIIIGPLFGVWADRFDRKTLAVLLQCLMFLQALALCAAVLLDHLSIGLLFGLTLVEGCIHAAYQPVRLALIPSLVRKQDLISAAAFTAVTFNVARFVGPAIAGFVIEFASAAWAILFNAFSYLFIIGAWYFIRIPPREQPSRQPAPLWHDMREGWRYIVQRPALAGMFMLLTAVALFARPLSYMLSAFVGAVFAGGPRTLALFTASVGAGAVVAGMKLSMDGHARGMVRGILSNTVLAIVAMGWFASTSHEWLATLLIFVFGYTITVSTVASQTLVQNRIDDEMRGRVLSLWVAFTRGAPALGVLVIGWFSSHFGLMWPNLVAALLCFACAAALWKRRQQMRQWFEE